MPQEKPEQSVESMADAEGVDLVVKAGYVFQADSTKSPADRRIAAFRKELFPKRLSCFLLCAEYGRQDQET